MFDLFKRNPRAAGLAIAMHLVLIFLLIFGLDWLVPPKDQRPAVNTIQAQVVDASAVAAEAKRLEDEQKKVKAQEEAKKREAEKAIKDLQKKQEQEQKKLQEIENQRKVAEQKRKLEEKRKVEEEQKRKQQEAEQKRKAEAETKQKAEAEKKRKADEEAKQKAEAEKKRKADEDRKRRESDLQKALEAEQSSQQNAQAINAFALAVTERVTSNWIRPPATDLGLKVKLKVRVSDQGSVLAVQVIESSGNSAFDRSAEAAVYKSDPLPAPPPGVRELNFIFDPDRV